MSVMEPLETQFLSSLMLAISALSSTRQWKTLRVAIVKLMSC